MEIIISGPVGEWISFTDGAPFQPFPSGVYWTRIFSVLGFETSHFSVQLPWVEVALLCLSISSLNENAQIFRPSVFSIQPGPVLVMITNTFLDDHWKLGKESDIWRGYILLGIKSARYSEACLTQVYMHCVTGITPPGGEQSYQLLLAAIFGGWSGLLNFVSFELLTVCGILARLTFGN